MAVEARRGFRYISQTACELMHDIELILGLLVVVAAFAWLAARIRVPYPILLVIAGLGIGFIPGLPRVTLRPDLVFLLFLPPILYYAGLMTSWRDFRNNVGAISMLSVGLVLFTTCAVAAVAHGVIHAMTWPAAFVLGAIVSPPDAVAATAILQRMRIPKRVITILEGESLVNDAMAIVAYRFAVAGVVYGTFSLRSAGPQVLIVGAGGVAFGYVVGRVITWVRPRLRDAGVETMVSLLTPFIAYLPAEWLHVSGVLAAVTAGLYVGRRVPQITTGQQRLRLYGVWETVIFIINGIVFILIGLQLPAILERLRGFSLPTLIAYAAVVSLVTVLARFAWVYTTVYVPRLLSRRLRERDPAPPRASVFAVAWIALRGIVSLATALALPLTLADQVTPFPARDLILFITFGVILVTLVAQGLTLPAVIRALALKGDEVEEQEEAVARLEAAHAALARLEALGFMDEGVADLIARVREPYDRRVQYLSAVTGRLRVLSADGDGAGALPICRTTDEVLRYAITAEREMLISLRDAGTIGDDVLRRVQQDLDLDEAKLAANVPVSVSG
ncbi:MAG: Na+/H+ antiporter [Phycisphaerales bacterium]|nr:Na+/H+ antiporter [Phycisphaerales bacterium]